MPVAANAVQTSAPGSPPPAAGIAEQKQQGDANVTPQPSLEPGILSREERIEYRDQDGNLLDEEQVASLEGKVEFSTRYETRTRILDAAGKEIGEGSAGAEGFAPPHPDIDRQPETAPEADDERDVPATASPQDDLSKEKSAEQANDGKPKPASEGNEATK